MKRIMKQNEIFDDCMECFFKAICNRTITSSEFDFLFQSTMHQNYKKGEIILKQNMKTPYLVYLKSGIVKFVHQDNDKELIITIDKSPTLLGLANILNEDVNLFSIVAIENCIGCLIDITKFKLLVTQNRTFGLEIMSISTGMFRKSVLNFISLAHKQAHGRMADIILFLSQNIYESNKFQLSLTREELAEFAGCSKENVIHTLRALDVDGIIKISGKNIEIIDADRLHKISKSG
jgi:CRP/FNR family transcriptional regulator, polysaccharide utilization system transcription regulator